MYERDELRRKHLATAAATAALAQLGKPYADDFQAPPAAFYCSSLVVFAYSEVVATIHGGDENWCARTHAHTHSERERERSSELSSRRCWCAGAVLDEAPHSCHHLSIATHYCLSLWRFGSVTTQR